MIRGRYMIVVVALLVAQTVRGQYEVDPTMLEVNVVAENLTIPWDLVWDDGKIWFTEKQGNIKVLDPETGSIQHIHKVEGVFVSTVENSGLHALALHPNWPDSSYLFCHYSYDSLASRLTRFRYHPTTQTLSNPHHIIPHLEGARSHNGSRLVVAPDNTLFFCTGDAYLFDPAQDVNSLNGKVLRFNPDGTVPADNPYPNSLVWSIGHRNPQGLTLGPNGQLYNSEHGPSNDDELNHVVKGGNYGWPKVNGKCDLPSEQKFCIANNVVEPLHAWTPTEAPSGLHYYAHEAIPEWNNCLLQAFLKARKIGALQLSEDGTKMLGQKDYFEVDYYRFRDVLVTPDGRVFACTSNKEVANPPQRDNDDKIIEIRNYDYHHEQQKFRNKKGIEITARDSTITIQVNKKMPGATVALTHYWGGVIEAIDIRPNQSTYTITHAPQPGVYFVKVKWDAKVLVRRLTYR